MERKKKKTEMAFSYEENNWMKRNKKKSAKISKTTSGFPKNKDHRNTKHKKERNTLDKEQ